MNSGMLPTTGPGSDDWETPGWLYRALDVEFKFDLDPAASATNAKCARFYTLESDGLVQSWSGWRTFVNPPYSEIARWTGKAVVETARGGCPLVVMLLPSRTDTGWFHRDVLGGGAEVRWFRKRIDFEVGGVSAGAPRFGSLVAIWRGVSHL